MTAVSHLQALQRLHRRAWAQLLDGCASPALQAAVCAHLPQHACLGSAGGYWMAAERSTEFFTATPSGLRMQPVRAAQPACQGVQP